MMIKKYIFFLIFIFAIYPTFGQGDPVLITLTLYSQTVNNLTDLMLK